MLLEAMTMALVLTSTAFSPNGSIPKLYTCEGSDISPPLAWADAPDGTRSYAKGTLPGLNDWKKTGYGGPCPPIGRHRYFHKLYALDSLLPDLKQPTKAQLLAAMKGHVLAETQLIGTYQKGQ